MVILYCHLKQIYLWKKGYEEKYLFQQCLHKMKDHIELAGITQASIGITTWHQNEWNMWSQLSEHRYFALVSCCMQVLPLALLLPTLMDAVTYIERAASNHIQGRLVHLADKNLNLPLQKLKAWNGIRTKCDKQHNECLRGKAWFHWPGSPKLCLLMLCFFQVL